MKKILLFSFILVVSTVMTTTSTNAQTTQLPHQVLRHVVLFKFKDSASATDVKTVVDAFKALRGKIALIKDFEWGTNNSPEKVNQGLTHCFLASFASEKERDAYLIHPDHIAFTKLAGPIIDKVTVVDYWVEK